MRSSATTALIVVLVAATIMALGYAAITGTPYSHKTDPSCADHEIALLAWGVLAGLVVSALGTMTLASLKSPEGAYVLLVGVLTLVAGIGFTLSTETHEFCGRESWWKEGAVLAGLTFVASLAGLGAGYLGWQAVRWLMLRVNP